MAHFVGTTALLKKGKVFTSLPAQADFAEWISGTVFSDKGGKLEVQECFDLPVVPSAKAYAEASSTKDLMEKWAAEGHWAPTSWPEYLKEAERPSTFTVTAKTPLNFTVFAGAPYWRLVYTNGESDQSEFGLYARSYERGKV
jgi:hypothetical protein